MLTTKWNIVADRPGFRDLLGKTVGIVYEGKQRTKNKGLLSEINE